MAAMATGDDGVIRSNETYVKAAFLTRTRMKETAFRTARRNGLRVVYAAGRCFVRGSDWFAYLDSLAANQESRASRS